MDFKKLSTKEAKSIGDKLKIDWKEINIDEFRLGLSVELEHGSHDQQTNVTDDNMLATGKIALAHLKEIPNYYTLLNNIESEAKSHSDSKNDTRGED